MQALFRRYDTDNSGSIDKVEFVGLLRDLGSRAIGWKLEDAFEDMDADKSGGVQYDEFVKCGSSPFLPCFLACPVRALSFHCAPSPPPLCQVVDG